MCTFPESVENKKYAHIEVSFLQNLKSHWAFNGGAGKTRTKWWHSTAGTFDLISSDSQTGQKYHCNRSQNLEPNLPQVTLQGKSFPLIQMRVPCASRLLGCLSVLMWQTVEEDPHSLTVSLGKSLQELAKHRGSHMSVPWQKTSAKQAQKKKRLVQNGSFLPVTDMSKHIWNVRQTP